MTIYVSEIELTKINIQNIEKTEKISFYEITAQNTKYNFVIVGSMCGITNKSTIIMLCGCSMVSITQTGQQAAAQHLIAVLNV